MMKNTQPVSLKQVKIEKGFWGYYRDLAFSSMIPHQWRALNDDLSDAPPSYSLRNLRLAADRNRGLSSGETYQGPCFLDSDLAKWLEAAAGWLAARPDEQLEKSIDEVIDLLAAAQEADGYLNTFGSLVLGKNRWRNLRDEHELYCSGHLIEAAVAYFEATGKRRFIDIMERNVACIAEAFGREPGQCRGYPGHPELELALMRLFHVTGNPHHARLARYFIEERGQQPLYFEEEKKRAGREQADWPPYIRPPLRQYQAHKPLKEQQTLDGHAVRALYLLSGLVDVAAESGSSELMQTAERLWDNCIRHRLYVTGGVGSTHHGEAFTFDNHLPNGTAYAETCASIALVFAARRMLEVQPRSAIADVMERALYNNCLASVQLDGTRFFYVNPLQVWPSASQQEPDHWHVKPERQKWFGCACCPTNLIRLLSSLDRYVFTYNSQTIYQHLYIDSEAVFSMANGLVQLTCRTRYPADGAVTLHKDGAACRLAWRVPGWCRQHTLMQDGRQVVPDIENGYIQIDCPAGPVTVSLTFDMQPCRVTCDPAVPENIGKVCLQRGPLLYCLEEADQGRELWRLYLPDNSPVDLDWHQAWPGDIPGLKAAGYRQADGPVDSLYRFAETPELVPVRLNFVPYYVWGNRGPGEMLVWLHALPG